MSGSNLDLNDWRHSASRLMSQHLGLDEVSVTRNGKPARTFPSILPMLRLDRIYVRGDGAANYGTVMQVMGALSGAGFTKIGLLTDQAEKQP